MTKKWGLAIIFFILAALLSGGITFYFKNESPEVFTIDPQVELKKNQTYQITYWDYPLYVGQEGDYEEFLQQAIKEFSDSHPNIEVNYRLLSFVEGRKKLMESLKEGSPPDVYHAVWGRKLVDKQLQVPVSIFFKPKVDIKQDYQAGSIQSFRWQDKIWGLPQWLAPQVWVGNQQLLAKTDLDLKQIINSGWTNQEFCRAAQQISDLGVEKGIFLNPYNANLFYQLLAVKTGSRQLVTQQENLAVTAAQLKDGFQFLERLQKLEVFPVRPEQQAKRMVAYFGADKAGIIAPTSTWLLANLYQRAKTKEKNLVLLPPPGSKDNRVPVLTAGLLLFRQQDYQGDAHTKAAYQWARFINRKKSGLISRKLKVVPAVSAQRKQWKQEVDLKKEFKKQLLDYSRRGIYNQLTGFGPMNLALNFKGVIANNYQRYWLNDLAPEKATRDIIIRTQEIKNLN